MENRNSWLREAVQNALNFEHVNRFVEATQIFQLCECLRALMDLVSNSVVPSQAKFPLSSISILQEMTTELKF